MGEQPSHGYAKLHGRIERRAIVFVLAILGVCSIGGLVEIAPLFALENTVEPVRGMRPYTPLELAGRAVYIREGCYACHSQQIRPFRDEVERYGAYSLAAESAFDHPFQWGSKRTGPDLARIGGRYSDEWHVREPRTAGPARPAGRVPARQTAGSADARPHRPRQRDQGAGARPCRACLRHRETPHGPRRPLRRPVARHRADHAVQPRLQHAPPGLDRGENCARLTAPGAKEAGSAPEQADRKHAGGPSAFTTRPIAAHHLPLSGLFEVSPTHCSLRR
ncbi:cytochrome-c oxidase, cbb3-type subunit II [Leptolyngbya sp. 15MV]|nr:cytochrome-c oxidase, cbb3-type subunit II [Leptolyngbya sp. 15MV]